MAAACPSISDLEAAVSNGALDLSIARHLVHCEACREVSVVVSENMALLRRLQAVEGDHLMSAATSLPVSADVLRIERDSVPGYEIDTASAPRVGGQGAVFSAIEIGHRRRVVIKVLGRGDLAPESERTRFEQEIELTRRLSHDNVVTLLGCGFTLCGHRYYVMPDIRGVSLDRYVKQHGLCVDDRVRLFARVCAAISFAHQKRIVHLDLKPSNILVDQEGEPRVLDFGIADQLNDPTKRPGHRPRRPDVVWSTLAYSAPEQICRGRGQPDRRTDVYALGAILFELLVGRRLFEHASDDQLVQRILSDSSPPPPSHASDAIEPDLDRITLRALAKAPLARYDSAGQLQKDIDGYLERLGEPCKRAERRRWSWAP